jgi:hypothetical protein
VQHDHGRARTSSFVEELYVGDGRYPFIQYHDDFSG